MNKRISGSIFLDKKVFPLVWIVFLIAMSIVTFLLDPFRPVMLVYSVLLAIVGFLYYRIFVWDLADEVFDAGEHLIFRRGSTEEIVELSNVENIRYQAIFAPTRVVLTLREPISLGSELRFTPLWRLNPFAKPDVVKSLALRLEKLGY